MREILKEPKICIGLGTASDSEPQDHIMAGNTRAQNVANHGSKRELSSKKKIQCMMSNVVKAGFSSADTRGCSRNIIGTCVVITRAISRNGVLHRHAIIIGPNRTAYIILFPDTLQKQTNS